MYKYLWLIFLCGSLSVIQASPLSQQPSCVIAQEAPCSFVNDSVNVIGGNFFWQMHHLHVPGHVPLHVIQYYNNQSQYTSWVGAGMTLNYSFKVDGRFCSNKKHDKHDRYDQVNVELPGGSIICAIAKEKDKGVMEFYLDPAVIHKSFSNCGSGEISGRTNLKNFRIKEYIGKEDDSGYAASRRYVYLPDGTMKKFHTTSYSGHQSHVMRETRLNGTQLNYKYKKYPIKKGSKRELKGINRNLKQIRASAKDEMNWLKFYKFKKRSYITASNGKRVDFYQFTENGKRYIKQIESTDNPTQAFSYLHTKKNSYINKISWPQGRFLEIDYDDKGRVIAQRSPVGINGEGKTIWSFTYLDDKTEVQDAFNQKKTYNHHKGRIYSIDEFANEKCYRTKKYYWGKTEGHSWGKLPEGREGNLLAYATLDDKNEGRLLCHYKYDDYGNILRETLFGNLSGNSAKSFQIPEDGKVQDTAVEKHCKYFKYSGKHLPLEIREDGGAKVEFRYKADTDLVWAKFTYDNDKIILREFYNYDENSILIKKVVDDGCSDNKSCLDGVTEQLITEISPTMPNAGFGKGLPEGVREKFYDLENKTVTLLKHTHYNYNKAGQVIEEAIFDSNDDYSHSIWYVYDEKGRLVQTKNSLGRIVEYKYDENGNKIYEKQEGAGFHTVYEYDLANRCTAIIEHHPNNTQIRTSSEYDLMDRRVSSTDRYGCKTTYEYDSLGRLIKTTFPKLEDGVEYTIQKEYDIFDNVIKETAANGQITQFEYTSRKQPSLITYADGSQERFEYNLNGTLQTKHDKNGTKTTFTYDVLGRVVSTTLYDSTDKVLSSSTNKYNSFHLLSTTDAMGFTTSYRYDGAGRKIEELQTENDNFKRTVFEYDGLSRVVCTKNYFSDTDYIAKKVEYDCDNRVVVERIVDSVGNYISWNRYEYDLQNNRTLKRSSHTHEDADIRVIYNSKCEAVEVIDECNNSTKVQYNHSFINSSNQNVLQKITTDALQNSTEEYFDILGRLKAVVKKNASNQLLAATDYFYNASSKKIKQVEHVIVNGQVDHDYVIVWEYDIFDNNTRLIEQTGSSEEKITSYTYDAMGRIVEITKPDTVVLTHSYDPIGRLVSLASSDNSVNYTYIYDLHNNPVEITDSVDGLITKRSYDRWNRLIEDGVEGVQSIKQSYDALGRVISLTAPDNSSIKYCYENYFLKKIQRYSSNNVLQYEHTYNAFDAKGRVLESSLINNLGTLNVTWDKKGRNIKIDCPYFTQQISEDGFDAVGNLKAYSFSDAIGEVSVACNYDDLYQLVEEKGWQNHVYAHDSINNRLSKNHSNYAVDEHNKVLSDGKRSFTYDKNGNLLQDEANHYTYDALNRLTSVTRGKTVTKYTYDSFNRRVKKNDTYSLYQGMREIGTLKNDNVEEFRVLGLGKGAELGASVAIELAGQVYCPIHDFRGNIVCLIKDKNYIAESYRYTAYGECEVHSHKTISQNPWRFASKRYDSETGFTYFLNRYYSPILGHWLSPDPVGFADGPNIYAYVHNNPMTKFDLYGLFMEDEDASGRSDLALAAFGYGIIESMWMGSLEMMAMLGSCRLHDCSFDYNLYNSISHAIHGTAGALRGDVISQLQHEICDANSYHQAGSYVALGTGIAAFSKFALTETFRAGGMLKNGLQTGISKIFPSRAGSINANSGVSTAQEAKALINANLRSGIEISKKQIAESSKNAQDLKKHLKYLQDDGSGGIKVLQNGRIRYYDTIVPPRNPGKMAGCRYVQEFNYVNGRSRGWMETVDHQKRIRQVRPQLDSNIKTHYKFDENGNYTGSW